MAHSAPAAAWVRTLPIIRLQTGAQPIIVDLAAYYPQLESIGAVRSATDHALQHLDIRTTQSAVDARHTAVAFRGNGNDSSGQFVAVELKCRDHITTEAVFAVEYLAVPPISFVYRAPAGAAPKAVFVAGAFNGWNANSHPLKPTGQPGEFSAEFNLPLGRSPYKLVVDGQWMADPAAQDSESDGMGGKQSLLTVAASPGSTGPGLELIPQPTATGERICLRGGAGCTTLWVLSGNQLIAHPSLTPGAETELDLKPLQSRLSVDGIVRLFAQGEPAHPMSRQTLYRAPRGPMAPEWRGRTIYFAFTDRFANGDPSNDNPVPVTSPTLKLNPGVQYQGGDWKGLREKIEAGYFDQLGVGALWISGVNRQVHLPMKESVPPGNYFTAYHGYWPSHPTEPNPNFGSMEDLRALVEAAHKRGMYVLLDLVAHHVVGTGDAKVDHPWFTAHPEWFGTLNLADGRKNIRLFDEHPFTTWFDDFLPAFDYGDNPAAIAAMTENAVWWVRQTGVDGFRQDAVKHIVPEFWAALTRRLRDDVEIPEGRRLFQIGETISSRAIINQFVSGEMLDGQFDFPLYWPLRGALASRTVGFDKLAEAIQLSQDEYPDEALMSPLLGNHDVSRFMAYAAGDLKPDASDEKAIGWRGELKVSGNQGWPRLTQAQALVLTLPGCPMLYYGDEIGMTGAQDPDNRRMMPWKNYTPEQQRALEQVRALGQLRQDSPALKYGAYQPLLATTDTLAFARISMGRADERDQVMITVLHAGPQTTLEIPLPPNLRHLQQATTRFSTEGMPKIQVKGSDLAVTIPADGVLVLDLH